MEPNAVETSKSEIIEKPIICNSSVACLLLHLHRTGLSSRSRSRGANPSTTKFYLELKIGLLNVLMRKPVTAEEFPPQDNVFEELEQSSGLRNKLEEQLRIVEQQLKQIQELDEKIAEAIHEVDVMIMRQKEILEGQRLQLEYQEALEPSCSSKMEAEPALPILLETRPNEMVTKSTRFRTQLQARMVELFGEEDSDLEGTLSNAQRRLDQQNSTGKVRELNRHPKDDFGSELLKIDHLYLRKGDKQCKRKKRHSSHKDERPTDHRKSTGKQTKQGSNLRTAVSKSRSREMQLAPAQGLETKVGELFEEKKMEENRPIEILDHIHDNTFLRNEPEEPLCIEQQQKDELEDARLDAEEAELKQQVDAMFEKYEKQLQEYRLQWERKRAGEEQVSLQDAVAPNSQQEADPAPTAQQKIAEPVQGAALEIQQDETNKPDREAADEKKRSHKKAAEPENSKHKKDSESKREPNCSTIVSKSRSKTKTARSAQLTKKKHELPEKEEGELPSDIESSLVDIQSFTTTQKCDMKEANERRNKYPMDAFSLELAKIDQLYVLKGETNSKRKKHNSSNKDHKRQRLV